MCTQDLGVVRRRSLERNPAYMNENQPTTSTERIEQKLQSFASREKSHLVLGFVLALLGVFSLVAGLMALGAYLEMGRQWVVGVGLGLLALSLAVIGLFVGMRSYQARSALRQARLVEEFEPRFRMRLLTVVECNDRPRDGRSEAMMEWTSERTAGLLEPILGAEIHPIRRLRSVLMFFACSSFFLLGVEQFSQPGVSGLIDWMNRGDRVVEAKQDVSAEEVLADAIVGEILLRYTYPAYTELPELEVPNSNGTAYGPPGTRVDVEARTAESYDSVSMRHLDEPLVQAELEAGRDIRASFVISEAGTYQFHLQRVEQSFLSQAFDIEVEPDHPPTVQVEATSDRIEIELNKRLPISWRSRDDFGVNKVVAVVGGKEVLIRDPAESKRSLEGAFRKTPQELGLKAGQEVELKIRAWDNDEVSGSKAGDSRSIRVKVLGPKASSRRTMRLWRELRDALLDMLAEHTTDTDPPAKTQSKMLTWAGEAAGRLDPVDELVDKYWDAFKKDTVEALILEEIRRVSGSLLRFAQSISKAGSDTPILAADLKSFSELRGELIERSEQAILMLDQMIRYQALAKLNQLAQVMAGQAEQLDEREKNKADMGELLGRLDMLERQAKELKKAAADFNGGDLSEFVDRSMDDAERLMKRIRDLVGTNKEQGARKKIPQLAENLRMMADGVNHMQRQMESEGEEMASMIEELKKELERLEKEERELQESTKKAREKYTKGQDSIASLWALADKLALEAATKTGAVSSEMDSAQGFSSQEINAAVEGNAQAIRLQQAVASRDLSSARVESSRAELRTERALDTLNWREGRRDNLGKGIPAADGYRTHLSQASKVLGELSDLLQRLDLDLNTSSPQLQTAAQKLGKDQSIIRKNTESAQKVAKDLAEKLPMGAPGLNEGMEGAVREMKRAIESLNRGRTVEAEGAEGAAADRVRQAKEALEQAAAAMAQMQDAMRGEGQGSDPQDQGGRGEEEMVKTDPIEIPAPEEFQTPEEYRKALLEGMQGEVPSEYEALKRRYYEDLVRQ